MMVATGKQTRARRRAERGRVKVGVLEAVVGELRDVRRVDEAAERARPTEPDVVEDDVENVRCSRGRARRNGEGRLRHLPCSTDPTGEWLAFNVGFRPARLLLTALTVT